MENGEISLKGQMEAQKSMPAASLSVTHRFLYRHMSLK